MTQQLIASYPFALLEANGLDYQFVTDDNITYFVFIDDDLATMFPGASFAHDAVQLVLKPAPGSKLPIGTDPRISATMAAILEDFLERRPLSVVAYACSYADNQEAARARKFINMFTSGNTQGKYKQVTYKKGRNQGAFIYKDGHPADPDILKEAIKLSK